MSGPHLLPCGRQDALFSTAARARQAAHQVTEYSPVSAAFHARMGTGVTDVCTSQPNFDMGAGR